MSGNENTSLIQRAIENIWFLLLLGVLTPGIFYFAWGLLEIFTIPEIDYSIFLGGK